MDLEREAATYTKDKQTQFNDTLCDHLGTLESFVNAKLYSTKERSDISYHLLMVKLLCNHSAATHGIK